MKTSGLQWKVLLGLVLICGCNCGCKTSGDTSARKAEDVHPSTNPTAPKPEAIQPPKEANRQANPTNALTFWVISEKPVDGGRYIDTPLFPKLGFVRNQPDLRVNRLKTVFQGRELLPNDKGEEIESIFLNVHLIDEDAPALTKLTSDNQGKRVLIMVDDRQVAALRILAVLGSTFQLHCKDDQTLKEVREKLAYLLSQ